MRRCLVILLLLAIQALGKPYSTREIGRVDRLLGLLELRLRISKEVARAKWNSGAPVEDLAREAKVVEAFLAEARLAQVEPDLARALIEAQIAASKMRQNELMGRWQGQRHSLFPRVPDLAGDIRPRLDWLSCQLAQSLAEAAPLLEDRGLLAWRVDVLWGASLDGAQKQALKPLLP